MGDAAGAKQKKVRKHGEDGAPHDQVATTGGSTSLNTSTNSLAPQIVVQGADGVEGTGKQRRTSKSSHSLSATKPEEKTKDKTKDKERRKLAKEASHSTTTQAVEKTPDSAFLHEGVVYKHAGRLKGTSQPPTPSTLAFSTHFALFPSASELHSCAHSSRLPSLRQHSIFASFV